MVLHLMKQRQHYISADQSRQLKVKPSEYKSLLARLQQLPELQSFVNDKLRHVTTMTALFLEQSS